MKIVMTLKSKNEENNIRNAIECYHDWVDEILLADGGSTDRTIEIASEYPKVCVRPFRINYEREDGSLRNHEGKHLNFLFEWAKLRRADWIIHDDCDCVLSPSFKKNAREIIEDANTQIICAVRLYVYGSDMHFRKMSFIKGRWETSLWAWRTGVLKAEDARRHFTITNIEQLTRTNVLPPLCILHKFAPNEETITRKVNDYKLEAPTAVHPRITYGEPEPLPEWATQ